MYTVRLRPHVDRPVSAGAGILSRHGLSFGVHYDPERTSFGALAGHNDDVLEPGVGYGAHEHRDVEILSWVLAGAMAHRGPDGSEDVVRPGVVQCLAAGTGWHHDERNHSDTEALHLLQMWITPALADPPPGEPSLAHADVADALAAGEEVVLASGRPEDADRTAVTLRRGGVRLTVVGLESGVEHLVGGPTGDEQAAGPTGDGELRRHVHVARGSVVQRSRSATETLEAGAGDTLEVVGDGDLLLTAGPDGAEVLVLTS